MITLYVDSTFYSPYALSAFVAVVEKGVPFRLETVELGQPASGRGIDFGRDSVTARVPAIDHAGFSLAESSAIAEYIDEVFEGPTLYPRDPQERALARMVQAWIRSDMLPLRKARSSHGVFHGFGALEPLSGEARQGADKLIATACRLLAHGGSNLLAEWCIADTDLAMMLMRLAAAGEPLPASLLNYTRQQWARPSIARWLDTGGHPKPSI